MSRTRDVPPTSLVAGAGSSALIYLALQEWLTARSRVVLLDPTYGEYDHVLDNVIGCTVDRLTLRRDESYDVDMSRLLATASGCDLVILVNPNSPTGRLVSRPALVDVISAIGATTRVSVDETYVDFVDASQSMEQFAAASSNVVVGKSMSKAYALSGARVA